MEYSKIFNCFPSKIRKEIDLEIYKNNLENEIEEIRIRNNLPIILQSQEQEKIIDVIVTTEDINLILQKICENSLYSYQNQIINRLYHNIWRK